ncbi:putative coiled-coil domain-containing protein 55 [Rosellinia necatrix]|uniref:Putative coiled-coil domain-containing protein 55 n=1 Tax=Rosellinia necatrix TaxID=77044 RepID=A0A1W2TRM7_ROSNE|nr:putative coiled-coil domain-containing protein 55 [Rosellinia necatrix]
MSKPGLSFGLNMAKKPVASKPAPPKRKPMFGGDDDSDDDTKAQASGPQATSITEFDDEPLPTRPANTKSKKPAAKIKNGPPDRPPAGKLKSTEISPYGDLSSALESRRHREAAEELDPSVYDYDGVYESLRPEKDAAPEDVERRPKYMKSLLASAAVRRRDALIAEEKKIAREREAEGEEYAGTEKFVTEAYKKQQEENRRIEEEERLREAEEARKNKGGGMTAFYKDLLEKGDKRHAEVVKAAEERARSGPKPGEEGKEETKTKTDSDIAREINEKGGAIAINEDGQVVDKRELLRGGLNLGAKKKSGPATDTRRGPDRRDEKDHSRGFTGPGGKQAMRERQTRMLEAQLEESLKRSLEQEEEERQKVERAAKSRKTETDISSAKERYLARKRQAEEEKKKGLAAD